MAEDANRAQVTQAVQQQYEAFPYPPVAIEQGVGRGSAYCSYILAQYARTCRLQDPQGKRAMVAGCGVGHEIHWVAATNPGLKEIIGFDLSHRSIELAQKRLRYHQLDHCRARWGNLLEPDTLPEGPFDLITSYGVVHHTADPVLALSHLRQRLAPDGVMALMLYNTAGRYAVYRIRRALELLGIHQLPDDQKLQMTQSLLNSAQPGTVFSSHALGHTEYYSHPENIIDNFFHPQDRPYSIAEIPSLLAQSGLQFLNVVPGYGWAIEAVISRSNQEFYRIFDQLSLLEKLQIIEQLHPSGQTQNVFWCCHADSPILKEEFSESGFRTSTWQLNPMLIQVAEVEKQGIRRSLPELGNEMLQPLDYEMTYILHWPLLLQGYSVNVLSRIQLNLLLQLQQPRLGIEILSLVSEIPKQHLLHLLQKWEAERILLRVR